MGDENDDPGDSRNIFSNCSSQASLNCILHRAVILDNNGKHQDVDKMLKEWPFCMIIL